MGQGHVWQLRERDGWWSRVPQLQAPSRDRIKILHVPETHNYLQTSMASLLPPDSSCVQAKASGERITHTNCRSSRMSTDWRAHRAVWRPLCLSHVKVLTTASQQPLQGLKERIPRRLYQAKPKAVPLTEIPLPQLTTVVLGEGDPPGTSLLSTVGRVVQAIAPLTVLDRAFCALCALSVRSTGRNECVDSYSHRSQPERSFKNRYLPHRVAEMGGLIQPQQACIKASQLCFPHTNVSDSQQPG